MRSDLTLLDGSLASDLWIFHVVAQARTFEKASERLSVTQSAVSQRIARLELRLETTLFERKGRQARLTTNGEALFKSTTTAFDAIIPAIQNIRAAEKPPVTRINCVPSMAMEWLTPKLGHFLKSFPDSNIEIITDVAPLDQRRMKNENIDIGICYGPPSAQIKDALFSVDEFCFPVGSPDYVRSISNARTDIEGVTLLHDTQPWPGAEGREAEWSAWLADNKQPWPPAMKRRDLHFNLAQLAYRAAIDGIGLAMGRSRLVARYLRSGQLQRYPDQAAATKLALSVKVSGQPMSPQTSAFLEWLRSELESEAIG